MLRPSNVKHEVWVDHLENSKAFQNELIREIVNLSDGKIFDNYQEAAVQDKNKGYSEVILPFIGNELYVARQWDFYPYAKPTQIDVVLEIVSKQENAQSKRKRPCEKSKITKRKI